MLLIVGWNCAWEQGYCNGLSFILIGLFSISCASTYMSLMTESMLSTVHVLNCAWNHVVMGNIPFIP